MKTELSTLIFLCLFSLLPASAFPADPVAQVPGRSTNNCYQFTPHNHTSEAITDFHFSIPGGGRVSGKFMHTPPKWEAGIDANGDLVFKTPPSPLAGPHSSRPEEDPIEPGGDGKAFRFCLPVSPKGTELAFRVSYADGTVVPQGKFGPVPAGGMVVHNFALTCVKVRITTQDTPVYDVHFASVNEYNPHFDHVEPPAGWHGGESDDGTVVNLETGMTPLAPGQSADVELCFEHVPTRIAWKFTDAQHRDIAGASGEAKLK